MNRFFVSLTASSLPKPRTKTKTPLRVFCFLVELRGLEPLTYALRTHRSTN